MYNERFARQYHDGLPPEFPQTSPFTGTVHHLSGPNAYAHTQTCSNRFAGNSLKNICDHIYCALYDRCRELAHTLNSLVRVSRRAGHTYGSTYSNAKRLYMHTINTFVWQIRGLPLQRPVIYITHRTYNAPCKYVCPSFVGWLHYAHIHVLQSTSCCTHNKMHCWLFEPAISTNQSYICNKSHCNNHNNLTSTAFYVHSIAQNSCSYNYIFKVLFTTPSGYLFSIGFGHISIFRWALAPVRILIQKNINHVVKTVCKFMQVPYGAIALCGLVLQ